MRVDRAASSLYEPGSVFKIVTLSAAIDQGVVSPDDVIDCQNGAIYIAGHRIRDHKAYGNLTVSQILAYSSDVGAIKVGLRLGAPKFYDYIRAFGFGQLTGVDLPGESRGMLRRLENWTPVSVGSISMGQEIGVTPLQMITAVSAMANGGLIVTAACGPRNCATELRWSKPPEPQPRRVIKETTAATMRRMLEGVVLDGHGQAGALDGYTTAGKTGTAQKFDTATGHYSAHNLIASFVGFAPINTPAITVLVQLDSPAGMHEGGQVAAPAFKRVAQQVLAYMDVPHDIPVQPATLRASRQPAHGSKSGRRERFRSACRRIRTRAPKKMLLWRQPPCQRGSAAAPPRWNSPREWDSCSATSGKTVREVTEQCMKTGIESGVGRHWNCRGTISRSPEP